MSWNNGSKNTITCCYKCEKRYPGCHSSCEDYIKQKEIWESKKKAIKQDLSDSTISEYDFNRVFSRKGCK